MVTLDTLDLVRGAQHGNRTCLEQLFRRVQPRVRAAVTPQLGSWLRGLEESADVVQEVLVTAQQKLDTFEPRGSGSFLRWLSCIARNRIRDLRGHHHAQRRASHRLQSLQNSSVAAAAHAQVCDSAAIPHRRAERDDERHSLAERVGELPAALRTVVQLRYHAGMTFAAIAERVGCSEAGVRHRHARALVLLGRHHARNSGTRDAVSE